MFLFSGEVPRTSISSIYDEYHKAKTWKRHPYFPPALRAGSLISPAVRYPSFLTTVPGSLSGGGLDGFHWRILPLDEVFLLRARIRDIVSQQELVVQRARALA